MILKGNNFFKPGDIYIPCGFGDYPVKSGMKTRKSFQGVK
jgi:hypothetical protein